ncbi:serine/threonine-protein kinase [Nocardiopsis sp. NPDC006938]|uniref:serine/threonine-protein kinase n=1 Tax=Nocardiopsis sp. NPDC006938 TaxID=3364337 RepID=UPI00367B297E
MSPHAQTRPPFTRHHLPPGVERPAEGDPDQLGAYRVVGRIGAGGMGAVYAGLAGDGSPAAVKVVHPQFAANAEFRARFAREVGLVARVRATCTPAFLGADTQAVTPWLATEYVPGLTLRQYVREHGPLTGGVLTALAVGLAEALSAIHAAGVVHRDLKPGNVIMAPDGPKVLDFGIARAADGTALTATGGLLGTPGWVAPEQYLGQEASERSDLFAWGALVLFAATGENPFGTGQPDVLSHRVRTEDPDLSRLPASLLDPVRRALSKDPDERPTAAEALSALTGTWAATRVAAVDPADPTQVVPGLLATEWHGISAPRARRVRRRPKGALVAAGGAALALSLVAGAVFVWPGGGVPALGLPGLGASTGDSGADDAGLDGADVTSTVPAVDEDPEDWEGVLSEAIALANEVGSFEAYQRLMGASAHGLFVVHRYTDTPRSAVYSAQYGGPVIPETLAVGGNPVTGEGADRLSRLVSEAPTWEELVRGPYSRNTEPASRDTQYAEFGSEQWSFLWFPSRLLTPEADPRVTYLGVTDEVQNTVVNQTLFETEPDHGPAHHYAGTYTREASSAEGPVLRDYEFDLWIGVDGRFQRFQHSADQAPGEEDEFGGVDAWEVFVVSFDEPVTIEVPTEDEIEDSP